MADMGDDPTTLEGFRVMADDGRVRLQMACLMSDGFGTDHVKVRMTPDEARAMAADLVARAERVEHERS
jgi:hypothetical protein